MNFTDLNLIPELQKALRNLHFTQPTPIQQLSIPHLLNGKDLMGGAQTGTGKTAAFGLPLIQKLAKQNRSNLPQPKALILAPTRELAAQIATSLTELGKYTRVRVTTIYGGVSISNQIKSLQKGTDILIATPGRLLDLLHQGHIDTRHIATLILDEADRMVDMGFIKDVRTIINRLPAKRQNVLFTATLSNEIRKFSQSVLLNPEVVEIESVNKHKEVIDQSIYFVSRQDKRKLLTEILKERHADNVLVFMRTKRGADRLAKTLQKSNINTASIHGDKSQNQRENALAGFKQKKIRVLVATDLAARGIDISQLPLVVNYDLPDTPETYIHRIGRTGRAGENGLAFSFCSEEDKSMLQQINRHLNTSIRVQKDHPYHVNLN